ncbi:putative acyl CoA binding protein [Lyophyllum shimeji]|uniref:Acyl CoA binding protein n=1 Tax=Lyophyllum shimeji TaxID=47721 RepID=A0A9P3UHA0_LYOSH|nr:putative acyl CoA binding protein [Lyophyllum shimeji]
MATPEVIDAQFDRAVEIVQSLPKTGPIQTDYEEKLTMYSLYKQATVGNVKTPRPGIWDMLGRAKWDAWAKHRDLDPYEAKWLYVDALLKVLRKYSDKTVAMKLVEELEGYGDGDFSHINARQTHRSDDSDTSGSTVSDDEPSRPPRNLASQSGRRQPISEDEDYEDDEARELPVVEQERAMPQSQANRPPSSLSSHRYRTPVSTSVVMSPPPPHGIPATQPHPGFETPSAFAEQSPASSPSFPTMSSYVGQYSESSRGGAATPTHVYPHSQHRGLQQPLPPYGISRPVSRPALEHAIENVQAHLAALTERIDSLEANVALSRSNVSLTPRRGGSPRGRGSPSAGRGPQWDIDDLGMWSIVLNPISRGLDKLRDIATFFARNEDRSPTAIIIRRLCLDVSFLVCVLAVVKILWKKSGVRRREVRYALAVLWRAILGKPERMMADRAV